MKTIHVLLVGLVATSLVACSAPTGEGGTTAAPAPAPSAASSSETPGTVAPTEKHASATGTIEAIDQVAKTIKIAHGPVPELGWPSMTMTFQAPDVDLADFKSGDPVSFDLSATGMKATVTALKHQ